MRLPRHPILLISILAAINSSLPAQELPRFTLPDGLVAELAAGPPLVEHPIMAAFDDRGRLFVSENAGLNLNKAELEAQKPNSVRVLTDTNGDGIFDESSVFADGMTFPQGALWLMDSLYVMSPPSLWRFTDTDDDGVADEREELVTGFDYTGNAADVHGPFLHPNGRIYWCHGRKGHDVMDESTGETVDQGKGAGVWSCLPDGSDVRFFAGGGMDNPVEVDFTDTGEIVGTVNLFYGRPRGDVLVHWIRGGAYPRYDQETVIDEFLRTGPLLTEFHNFGHVAISGMLRYRTGALNPAWKDQIFATHFNTQEVTLTQFSPEGSTFKAGETESILKVHNPDVHITDIVEDANGDLLVLDTGGWFRIGCPTSQVAKPDIPGAIYRIRKAGQIVDETDYRGTEIDWELAEIDELAALLDNENFPIRERAITELAIRGEAAIPDLKRIVQTNQSSVTARQNAVWTLSRMQFSEAADLLDFALGDPRPEVQQVAANAIAATRTLNAAANNNPNEAEIEFQRNEAIGQKLAMLVLTGEPHVARAAGSALGAMADPYAVDTLLRAAGRQKTDRFKEHAAILSLIEISDAEGTRIGLESDNPRTVGAALWALEQMGGSGALEPLDVVTVLTAEDQQLQKTAVEIAKRHPEWDAAIAHHFDELITQPNETNSAVIQELAAHFIAAPPMQDVILKAISSDSPESKSIGFSAIASASDEIEMPASWRKPIGEAIANPADEAGSLALDALKNLKTGAFDEQLAAIANQTDLPATKRVRALQAMAAKNAVLSPDAFNLLAGLISETASPFERLDAAQMLANSKLTRPQQFEIAKRVHFAGPLDLPILWKTLDRNRDEETGRVLAENIAKSSGFGNLNPSELRRTFTRFSAETFALIEPKIIELEQRVSQQQERLAAITPKVATGDPEKGKAHFAAGKGACMTCHKIGEVGRAIGPDLSTIGRIRTERDLLESILYPSESIARDFESYNVILNDGTAQLGLIQRTNADFVHLTDVTGLEKPIPRTSVKSIQPMAVSIMPQGLDQSMSEEELVDLVAYLKSLK